MAQAVLLLLLVLLYLTVWKILRKRLGLRYYEGDCDLFERDFWHGGDLEDLEARAREGDYGERGLARVFLDGQEEFKKARSGSGGGSDNASLILDGVRGAMEAALQRENVFLGRHMQFLATVAGVSPYIGLLGTVWGIINAFQALTPDFTGDGGAGGSGHCGIFGGDRNGLVGGDSGAGGLQLFRQPLGAAGVAV